MVILINYNSILADRGKGIKELVKIMLQLFGNTKQLLTSMASIIVGVSQAPIAITNDDGEPEDTLCDDVLSVPRWNS